MNLVHPDRAAVVLLVAARFAWRRGARAVAVGCGALAVLPALALIEQTPVVAAGPARRRRRAAAVAAAAAAPPATVTRWGASARRKAGVASTTDIVRSRGIVRDAPPRRDRAALAAPGDPPGPTRAAVPPRPAPRSPCGCAGSGLLRVWASIEDVDRISSAARAPARPSGWPGDHRRPGRRAGDLHPHRSARPDRAAARASAARCTCSTRSGSAGRTSTITFDPLTGCADPVTAAERAADMLAAAPDHGGGGGAGVLGRPGPPQPRRAAARRRAGPGSRCATSRRGWPTRTAYESQILGAAAARSPEPAFEAATSPVPHHERPAPARRSPRRSRPRWRG